MANREAVIKFFTELRGRLAKNQSKNKSKTVGRVYDKYKGQLPETLRAFVELGGPRTNPSEAAMKYRSSLAGQRARAQWLECVHVHTCHTCGVQMVSKSLTTMQSRRFCSSKCQNSNRDKINVTRTNNMKKYGVKNVSQIESVRAKVKATNMRKCGVECNLRSKSTLEATEQLNLVRYGVKHHFASKEIQDKIEATNRERYGCKYAFQSKQVQEKYEDTMMERYGCKNPQQIPEVQEKTRKTNTKRYGTPHPMQSYEVRQKYLAGTYKTKTLRVRGKTFEGLQGYEPQAINHLMSLGYKAKQIDTFGKTCDPIKYKDGKMTRRYFPDLQINTTPLTLIEVKSDYTFNVAKRVNKLKFEAGTRAGYNMVLLIMGRKGELIKQIGEFM